MKQPKQAIQPAEREQDRSRQGTRELGASEHASKSDGALAGLIAQSPQAMAQRKLMAAVGQSPRMVAQRRQGAVLTGQQPQNQSSANRTGMPDRLKAGVESLSGQSMDQVKVHYNSSKPGRINALAYAQGNDIHLGPRQEKHLPHEAWHVAQQKQERVRATAQMKGVGINDEPALESEADRMGALAATYSGARRLVPAVSGAPNSAIQRLSKFSAWFIKEIVGPVILVKMPEAGVFYIGLLKSYIKIDDSQDAVWEVAIGFINAFFLFLSDDSLWQAVECIHEISAQLQAKAKAAAAPSDAVAATEADLQKTLKIILDHIKERDLTRLQGTRKYVAAEKKAYASRAKKPKSYQDVMLGSASALLLRPSSGAHYIDQRDAALTPLSHGPQGSASTYHRSAKHPAFAEIPKEKRSEALSNMVVKSTDGFTMGNGKEAHSGLYPNAPTFLRNQALAKNKSLLPSGASSASGASKSSISGNGDLYDQTLGYKLALCKKVEASTGSLKYLTVNVLNEYPLVMVHFNLEAFMKAYAKDVIPSPGAKKSFTSFLMNYYTGLANFLAKSAGMNIAMVERSSFGFNTPSIAETHESFRINMGLMPANYAQVQAHALKTLDMQLADVMKSKMARKSSEHSLKTDDSYFAEGKGAEVNQIDDWLVFAMHKIEKGPAGKSAIANAVRKRESLDFVNAQAFNTMAKYQGKVNGIGPIMAALFGEMKINKKTLTTDVGSEKTKYEILVHPSASRYPDDKVLQAQYEKLLETIKQRLWDISTVEKNPSLVERLKELAPLLDARNPHIEVTLDLANELILLHSMHEMDGKEKGSAELADGYGSESDVEDEDPDEEEHLSDDDDAMDTGLHQKPRKQPSAEPKPLSAEPKRRLLAGKKVITHNGMRALLSAIDSSVKVVYENKKQLNVDIHGAYYEMDDALKTGGVNAKALPARSKTPADVIVRDLNACVTDGGKSKSSNLSASPAHVWIIDTTSSTQRQMNTLIELFRVSKAGVLYLVSSGFKQEQFGADRNQYGTIRAFTDKTEIGKKRLAAIIAATKSTDKPLAANAQHYRQIMKKFGAVPRNRNILAGSKEGASSTASTASTSSDIDWASFSFTFGASSKEAGARDAKFNLFLTALKAVPNQADDAAAALRADHRHHANEYIHAQIAGKKAGSQAEKNWFNVTPNEGGGDCLLHALSGRNLGFDEVGALRLNIAAAALHTAPAQMSGSNIYMSMHQSGQMTPEIHDLMQTRHQIPRAVFQEMIKVPGMYAGDAELQAYCRHLNVTVYVVTHLGEFRSFTHAGPVLLGRLAALGQVAFLQLVRDQIAANAVVLYQSTNHWEKIAGVK